MTRPPRPSRKPLHLVLPLTLLGAGLAVGAPPTLAATVDDLAARLDEAIRQVEAAREGGAPLGNPGALFPATEEVTWGHEAVRVDHAGLRAEWQAVPGEGEGRRAALERLRHRLAAVRAELGGPGMRAAATEPPPSGWREKLTEILSRPEFKKLPAEEPLLARLFRWLRDRLGPLLPAGSGRTVSKVVRWVVIILAAAALLAVLAVLARAALPLFRGDRRARPDGGTAAPPPDTPENLLGLAEARARAGDFRGAVRAIFRWTLLSLHQAGRLDFAPSLTNREHLARLRADAGARAAFVELCGEFELAWYALRSVSREEYATFRARCQHLAGGRA